MKTEAYENEYHVGKQIEGLFHELGFEDADLSSIGPNHVGVYSEHSNQMFKIKNNGDVYYEGIEFVKEIKPKKIGNLKDSKRLQGELKKILV